MPSALVLLTDGFEEIETFTPIDILRRGQIEVTVASLNENGQATGRSRITAHADKPLFEVADQLFDLIHIPGGPGVKSLRSEPRVLEIVKRHYQAGRWIGAICAGPTVLYEAGLLNGKRYTAHFSVGNELTNILSQEKVVTDGKIITSRGAGTALEYALHLVALLTTPELAKEISNSICV